MPSKPYIIIQARMTSTRLPGKVMLPLCGVTVLEMMFKRLAPFHDQLIVATTNDGSEAPIVELCNELGIRSYRGDTDHVLSRYYECAVHFGAKQGDTIVRLTSDCPVIDPDIIAECIDTYETSGADYCSNTMSRSYPRGMDCEVFSFIALDKAYREAETPFETEHVTTFIHTTQKEMFVHAEVKDSEDNSRFRLTVDEPDDYAMVERLYKLLGCRSDFSYSELIDTLKTHPEVAELNAHVEQKKR